jgi:uncharacterized repeat protein (TIGR01451 family)
MARHLFSLGPSSRGALASLLAAASAVGAGIQAPIPTRAAPAAQGAQPNIVKSVSQTTANLGDTLTYTLVVSNPLAFPIFVQGPIDPLSPTLSVTGGTPGYANPPGTISWNSSVAPLGANSSSTYTFTAQIKSCGDIVNTAYFNWRRDGVNQLTRADSNAVGTKVNCEPQQGGLLVGKEASSATVTVGGTLVWTIRVTNTSSSAATYYGPDDMLPTGAIFQSATPGYVGPNPIAWNSITPATIAAGATDVYTVEVKAEGPCQSTLRNQASIKTNTGPISSPFVSTSVICDGTPKIVIEKEVSAATAAISNTLVYTLRVTNSGTAPGQYYGPYDPLPLANTTFQSATPGYTGPNPIAWNTATPKPIGIGATDVYTIAVHVDGPCGATFYNRAIVEVPNFPVSASNAVSTTVVCPNGWKIATPTWVNHGDVFSYVIALENDTDQPQQMSWRDAQLRVNPNQRSPYGVLPGDFDGNVVIEIGALPSTVVDANYIGPCRPPYLCNFVGQPASNLSAPQADASGVSWSGEVPAKTRLFWQIPVLVPMTPPCGKEIKNTVAITSPNGTVSYGVAVARVMCPDLGDAPDSSNHFGNPMRIDPFGAALPGGTARYPSVHQGAAAGDEGPLHRLAGSNSNLFTGAPANAIDSALGYRFNPQQQPVSPVSNEKDADWLPDQEPAWLKRNIIPAPVITNTRSNRDGHDNAFINPTNGQPLPFLMNKCTNGLVRYAQYVNPAAPHVGSRYVNMWIDLNSDGDWSDTFTSECGAAMITTREHVAVNVIANPATGVYSIPPFAVGDLTLPKRMWVRISIAESPAPAASVGNGPVSGYLYGETEDHYLCQKPGAGSNLIQYVPCPAPQVVISDTPHDGMLLVGKTRVMTMTRDTLGETSPVTVTWRIASARVCTRCWDLKSNKLLSALMLAAGSIGSDGQDPVTEIVTNGQSEVEVTFLEAGDYTITVETQSADGEVETETLSIRAGYLSTYLPLASSNK